MPKTHPRMKLSPEEHAFLQHWMYDEVHFQDGVGAAKRLQLNHRVAPAHLATIIAASIPDPLEQEQAARMPPCEAPRWPWSAESFALRVGEARRVLGQASTAMNSH